MELFTFPQHGFQCRSLPHDVARLVTDAGITDFDTNNNNSVPVRYEQNLTVAEGLYGRRVYMLLTCPNFDSDAMESLYRYSRILTSSIEHNNNVIM